MSDDTMSDNAIRNDALKVQNHPFFGSAADDTRSVHEIIRKIRQPRDFWLKQSKYPHGE